MNRITACPRCSTRIRVPEGITDKTLICVRCLTEVSNPWPGSQIQAAGNNTDVKRDVNAGCIVLGVFMGFCVLGVATAVGNREMPLSDQLGLLFFSCLAFVVLVFIAIIHWLVGRGNSGMPVPNVENVRDDGERMESAAPRAESPKIEPVPHIENARGSGARMDNAAPTAQIPKIESVFGCILLVLGTIAAAIIFTFITCAVMWKPTWH